MNNLRRNFLKSIIVLPALLLAERVVFAKGKVKKVKLQSDFDNDDDYLDYCLKNRIDIKDTNLALNRSHTITKENNISFNSVVMTTTLDIFFFFSQAPSKQAAVNITVPYKEYTSNNGIVNCIVKNVKVASVMNHSRKK